MKTEVSSNIRSIVGKVMAGLILTTMIGVVGVVPAHSNDHNQRYERHDRDRYERHDRDSYERRGRGHERRYYYNNGRRYYRAPVYRERVYVEPQVIYVPPRPPGISIFLPPLFFGN